MTGIQHMDLAEMTRRFLAMHTEWDSPHAFYAITWDGDKPGVHTVAMIDPALRPGMYPAFMGSLAADCLASQPNPPVVAFALQIEAYSVVKPENPTPQEAAEFEADRIGRRFHQRPDRVETAMVMCADITGRLWSATKNRDNPDQVIEAFRPRLDAQMDGVMTGSFVDGLDACAALARDDAPNN